MTTDNKFTGSGWQFPPEFSKGESSAMTVMASGPANIAQSLKVLLTTDPGERLMLPEYGCGTARLLFEPVDQRTITKLQNSIADAILLYEPRVNLVNVNIFQDRNNTGLLKVSIEYAIKATNSRFNLVYPFYINEATTVA